MILPGSMRAELHGWHDELEYVWEIAQEPRRYDLVQPTISKWSVGQHLEHLMLADTGILKWLHRAARGDERDSAGRPSTIGYFILTFGFFPRGKANAPKRTVPGGLDREVVLAGFRDVQQLVENLQSQTPALRLAKARWQHPSLGFLNAYQWTRFAHVHHRHHRKIMADIMRQTI